MTVTAPAVGDTAPDFALLDDEGNTVALSDLSGQRVVLYFYPKDDTSGCTTQACSLRDSWGDFSGLEDVTIYGVSPDSQRSHEKFRAKHDLPFPLLVDEDHQLADKLGFWVEKSLYGRKYWGVERSTVIIGPDGRIEALKRKVKPAEHTDWLREQLTA